MAFTDFAAKYWHLFLVAIASGGMLLWPLVRRGLSGAGAVGTLQATQLMNRNDAVVVDLRAAADFAKGHILGAINIPAAELDQRRGELEKYKARPVILSCADGNRSGAAAARLRRDGYAQAVSLAGGYGAWQQAGLPVEK